GCRQLPNPGRGVGAPPTPKKKKKTPRLVRLLNYQNWVRGGVVTTKKFTIKKIKEVVLKKIKNTPTTNKKYRFIVFCC
ncbi:hypothetical protein ACVGWW_09575, partial [Enterobacter hormaechei]